MIEFHYLSCKTKVKMVMHARSGGDLEIMGLMQGKIQGDTFVVLDAFPLPVEGTETRVNAQTQAYEYMAQYTDNSPFHDLSNYSIITIDRRD